MLLFCLALLPIGCVLFVLFVLKQSAWRAGMIGCLLTIAVSLFVPVFHLDPQQLTVPVVKGALTSTIVAYVILFGIFLFHLMSEAGVIQSIASLISQSTRDPLRQVLILAVAFSPLVESSSGFGIAMVVVAPILIALGFDRFKAVLISLVSLSAVPWGTLAMGTVIGANLVDMPAQQLGTGSALLSIPTFLYFAFLAVWIAGGWSGVKSKWGETLVVSGTFGLSVWLINRYVSVELAGVFGSLAALAVEFVRIRLKPDVLTAVGSVGPSEVSVTIDDERYSTVRTFSPYLFLIGLLLLTRIVPPIEAWLQSVWVVELPAYRFSFAVLHSPGLYLALTCLFCIVVFKIGKPLVRKCALQTGKQALPVILSTLFFIDMAEIMTAAGMTELIANTTAAALGTSFLILSPVIGGLGGFLTGSNTGSNAMLINLQVLTAQKLGIPPDVIAYGQNTSSSHLIMASPSRVLLGATVGHVQNRESELLRTTTWIGAGTISIVIIGVLSLYVMCCR
ncbi:L-lactate permease [Brevibacillus humidisoli]|uniref:L-lactate permease n=1 Tax=Brevibacillus humidisoli TaxID=2895522 RepID=UPI001E5AAC72|nr:L-lactate permease [Brevibacillus humidisoli]UFJ39884.1 L-lactate permease [Brevibacillus humidisoli]